MTLKELRKYKVKYLRVRNNWTEAYLTKNGYPITINGHVFFIGYIREEGRSGWRATDRLTGTWIGEEKQLSFGAAVEGAIDVFKQEGEDSYLEVTSELIKERDILSSPEFLAQRHSDYNPVLEFMICKEEENE